MSRLWTPPSVSKELRDNTNHAKAELMQMVYLKGVMDDFNKELKEIDPYLELALAGEKILAGNPLRPGYWHIIRHNPGAPPTVMTIEGPNGEYMEPNSEVFRMLKEDNDMWNPASMHRRRKREEELERVKERRKERERQDRQNEIQERWNAATRTQVSMLPNWSQNVKGRSGRRDSKTP